MGALGNRKGLKKIQVSQALNILPPHQDLPNYKKKLPLDTLSTNTQCGSLSCHSLYRSLIL